MNKYTHYHNLINGNTGCIGPKVWLFILVVGILIFGCKNEPKVDETVVVDSADYVDTQIIRRSGQPAPVVVIMGKDTSRYYSGDTITILIPKGYIAAKIKS